MSSRIRGQEAVLTVTVQDEFLSAFNLEGKLSGTFTKVREFTVSPRIDQTEEGYIGDVSDDLDQQIHGYDINFTVDELDAQALDFLSMIAFREGASLPPPAITIKARYTYRDGGLLPRTETFIDCILKPAERSVGGRKEYINNSFEAKSRARAVI